MKGRISRRTSASGCWSSSAGRPPGDAASSPGSAARRPGDGEANARRAAAAGADAVLVFPIGAFLSQPLRIDVAAGYHEAVAAAADLPLILFQLQPALGGAIYPS